MLRYDLNGRTIDTLAYACTNRVSSGIILEAKFLMIIKIKQFAMMQTQGIAYCNIDNTFSSPYFSTTVGGYHEKSLCLVQQPDGIGQG